MSDYQSAFSAPRLEECEISKHPLYPVLKFLLEKCDGAMDKFGTNHISIAAIDAEIEQMVRKCAGDSGSIAFHDAETHNLVVLSLQVLRIHLLELERVDDLSLDFSTRYINCLKQKMQTELLSSEMLQDGNEDVSNTSGDSMFESYNQHRQTSPDGPSSSTPVFAAHSQYHNPYCDPNNPTPQYPYGGRTSHSSNRRQSLASSNFDVDSNNRKRGVLPKQATQVMRQWLFQHLMHPYPKESEKQIMASQTGLSLLQVNNWFINARRRVLQPIMDRSNPPPSGGGSSKETPDGPSKPKHKKSNSQGGGATTSGAANRFWPEQLRNASAAAPLADSTAMSSSSSSSSAGSHMPEVQHNNPQIGHHQQLPPNLHPHQHHHLLAHHALSALLPGMGFSGTNENHLLPLGLKEEHAWMVAAAAGGELMSDSMAH